MDVDGQSQLLAHHGRAFDMPPRASRTPRRLPAGLAWLGPFPEGEIKGVAFAALLSISDSATGSLLLLVRITAAELAVIFGAGDIEIHIPISAVGRPFGFEFCDQLPNAVQAASGAGHPIGRFDVEPAHVNFKRFDVALAHLFHRAAFFSGPVEDFVVDIGVVLYEGHCITTPEQVSPQHVPADVTAGMTEVAEVIDRDAAAIDRCFASLKRFKRFQRFAECVEETQCHLTWPPSSWDRSPPQLTVVHPGSPPVPSFLAPL